ncbi:MAG: N-acetylneuraminate synthase family protein [Candidatus Thorarchaeota archaeon]
MVKAINISGRKVGTGHPCFIIAEAGSNHNGNLAQAKRLVDIAVEAKADAVKFQTFRAERLYPRSSTSAKYLNDSRSIYEIIKDLEMPYAWLGELKDYCTERDILFLSTPFDEESADKLQELSMPAYKIASYCLTHLPLLDHISRFGRPLILSTGLGTMREISDAVETIRAHGNEEIALLHCIASYPTPFHDANLRLIEKISSQFDVIVGYSDHTRDHRVAPIAAVALGASIIEKHFTISNRLVGPDHPFAVEPEELKEMIQLIRDTEASLGDTEHDQIPAEKELTDFARLFIYSTQPIKEGEPFTRENIAVLRSGGLPKGLPPKFFLKILGMKSAKDIPEEAPITDNVIANPSLK